jgi:hypothetical protein
MRGVRSADERTREPLATHQHRPPVDQWPYPLFEKPRKTLWPGSVNQPFGEGRKQFTAIAKFGEHNLAALHRQWARSIAVIGAVRGLSGENAQQILRHDRRLLAGRRGGLGVRCGAGVAEPENIRETSMLQRVLVDIQPALSAKGLERTKSGASCGGQTWIMSKLRSMVSFLSSLVTSNQAFFAGPSIFTRRLLNAPRHIS